MKAFKRFITYFDTATKRLMTYDNLLMIAYPNAPLMFTSDELKHW